MNIEEIVIMKPHTCTSLNVSTYIDYFSTAVKVKLTDSKYYEIINA